MSFFSHILGNLESKSVASAVIEIHGDKTRPVVGADLLDSIARAQAFLRSTGVTPGDRVALLAPNSARWVAADLAIIASGATVVPLYDRQEPTELAHMMRGARPSVVIAADDRLAEGLTAKWPEHGKVATFAEVFAFEPTQLQVHRHDPTDIVAIIYTSGTSGDPKGVMLSYANLDFMIPRLIRRLEQVVNGGDRLDRVFHFLPFCFAASRLMLWTQLSRPNPLMISTDLSNLIQEIATARPNYFLTVPAVLDRIRAGVSDKIRQAGGLGQRLYEAGVEAHGRVLRGQDRSLDALKLVLAKRVVFDRIKKTIGRDLEFVISGSAPLAEETQQWFAMIGCPVYQAYGLTETTGIVTLDDPRRTISGRVGHAIDGIEMKISDDGELLIRGPNIFPGYWQRQDATNEVMRDGWFHTGDQVDLQDGNLRIIGRIKNLIIPSSGHNVAPEPIEERLKEYCPDAEHCVVVGHGRPFLGVIITGKPKIEQVEQALERLNAEVPHYRKIRKFHIADESLSVDNGLLTANQKLRRRVVEQHFKTAIDSLYQ